MYAVPAERYADGAGVVTEYDPCGWLKLTKDRYDPLPELDAADVGGV